MLFCIKKKKDQVLNKIVANGKRFIAYGIIKKLQLLKKSSVLIFFKIVLM